MQENPKVSICLPVRNGAAYLRASIESALTQTFSDFELLLADDCSTDESADIIRGYARQDSRIVSWRNEKQLGLFANYNHCMDRAAGEFIKPFAQDDLWSEDLLAKQIALFNRSTNVVLVSARRLIIDESGAESEEQPHDLAGILGKNMVYRSAAIRRASLDHALANLIGEPCAVMFRSKARGSGFDARFRHAGDLEYWLRILASGDFGFVNEPLVFFRKHGASQSAINVRQLWAFCDLVHLAERFKDDLYAMNSSPKEFIRRHFALAAEFLPAFLDAEMELGELSRAEDCTASDLASLKQSFFMAMCMLADTYNDDKERAQLASKQAAINEWKIKCFESYLTQVQTSTSWTVTRPLRELNKLLSTSNNISGPDPKEKGQRQDVYLQYLHQTIGKILNSRSWKVTRWLRSPNDKYKLLKQEFSSAGATEEPRVHKASSLLPDDQVSSEKFVRRSTTSHDETTTAEAGLPGISASVCDRVAPRVKTTSGRSSSREPYQLILAVHNAERSGAPMLALSLLRNFCNMHIHCLVILKRGGDLLNDFTQLADVLNLAGSSDFQSDLSIELAAMRSNGRLAAETPVLVNTADLFSSCEAFQKNGCRIINLVHEFLSDYPARAREIIVSSSEKIIFSSQLTLADARMPPEILPKCLVLPQGLLDPDFGSMAKAEGRRFLSANYGIPAQALVILGCGTTDQRKGIDVFVQVAASASNRLRDSMNVHFVWIGSGNTQPYSPIWWAKKDVEQMGIQSFVHFTGEQFDLEPYFAGSDLFCLPSRRDPLPCVVQMAQASGLPVVAFKGSGGTDEILAGGGGKLVKYGCVQAMTDALLSYAIDTKSRAGDGELARRNIASRYIMANYVNRLVNLCRIETDSPPLGRKTEMAFSKSPGTKRAVEHD